MIDNQQAADGIQNATGQFAADLRALRVSEGNPTLHALAAATGVSKSVIAEAFKGERLPTENTVSRLVKALNADPQPWLDRRRVLDPRRATPPRGTVDLQSPPHGRLRARTLVLTAVVAAFAGAVVTSAVWAVVLANQPPAPAPNALPFETGVDPMVTACRNDAVIAAYEEREGGKYVVEMMYSNNCMAAWGRVTRYDERASGNELGMTVYPKDDPESDRTQERSESDVQSIYTPMLIEPDVAARVCGTAWVTVDGERLDLSPALCI